jgi:hypothetical protein
MTNRQETSDFHGTSFHVHGFHQLMNENDIMLAYCGDFSQDLNKTLLSFTERKFRSENVEDNTRRKIFNIMVEQLQNISKNKIQNIEGMPDVTPVFILGSNEEDYILISSNIILNEKTEMLKIRLDQVNALSRDELKILYREVRLNSSFTEKSGAGIGIIDMARKSENKLEYDFEKLDDLYSIFSLKIRVTKEKI